jgi:hypothetical protein
MLAAPIDVSHYTRRDSNQLSQPVESKDLRQQHVSKSRSAAKCAADSTISSNLSAPIDPDLLAIIERWPELPDAVKASILAMVRTSGDAK